MNALVELGLQFVAFAMVALVVLVLFRAAERRIAIHRRLMDQETISSTAAIVRDEQVKSPVLQGVAAAFLTDPQDRSKLRADLIQAGFRSPAAPVWYVIIRFSIAIGAPVVILLVNGLMQRGSGLNVILMALGASALGLVGPRMYINGRAKARRMRIEHQFPDALDLIMVCVEAGLGLESAFLRVGRETQESHPEISREFDTLADELSAGRTRTDALRAMGDRLDVESIKAFVALLVQTEALGVSIAQGLRTYSAEMRETRLLRAEEKALRIPVLMTVPLVACFMPVMIVALLLPAAIDLVRTLLPTLRGH
jgi:tight adherence protein C